MNTSISTSYNDFDYLNEYELECVNGGTVFGAISGFLATGAGACAVAGGATALKGAAAGATAGPIGAIAGGAAGMIAGALIAYNNL